MNQDFVEEIDIKYNFQKFWYFLNKFIDNSYEISSIYNISFYKYQKEYCISRGTYNDEKSKIFLQKGEIVCGYIFLLNQEKNIVELNFGTEFPGLIIIKENINKKTLSKFISDIDDLKSISKQIRFTIPSYRTISKSYEKIFMDREFSHKNIFSRSINLNISQDQLWKGIRKCYKSPINKGLREQEFILIDYKNPQEDIFRKIQQLHFTVAGRVTRSKETWNLQLNAIKKDNGFAIYSHIQNTPTGAMYVIKSTNHAYYSVGIYTDESKVKLHSHSLMWMAILYCKERNISLLEIDNDINYKYHKEDIDEKLIKISHFKSGFGGQILPKHEFII